MLKISSNPAPTDKSQELHQGARGSLRLCDQGMAEWSNNGDPDDCTAILRLDPVHLFEPVERNLNHSFDIVNNCQSIEVSKAETARSP
jgi:hypothetical protein